MDMDDFRFPQVNRQFFLSISPEQAIANMEEEKSFMAPSFVIISLPVCKQLKKRKIKRKKRSYIERITGKSSANMSYLQHKDDQE